MIKVRPFTGAYGSGEGFLFFRGNLSDFLMGQLVNRVVYGLQLFYSTGISFGRGGPGIPMEAWFCPEKHSVFQNDALRSWKHNLYVVVRQLLFSRHCTFELLGSFGLSRRLLLPRFYGQNFFIVDTHCRFLMAEGEFDGYLVHRHMFFVFTTAVSDEVKQWIHDAELRFASVAAASGDMSDSLLDSLFLFFDEAVSKYGLDMELLSESEVGYLRRRSSF